MARSGLFSPRTLPPPPPVLGSRPSSTPPWTVEHPRETPLGTSAKPAQSPAYMRSRTNESVRSSALWNFHVFEESTKNKRGWGEGVCTRTRKMSYKHTCGSQNLKRWVCTVLDSYNEKMYQTSAHTFVVFTRWAKNNLLNNFLKCM